MYALMLGDMRLSPRSSIAIEEPDDFERITLKSDSSSTNGGCPPGMTQDENGVCTPIEKRSMQLKLHLQGASHLDSAFNLKRLIDAELEAACTTEKLLRRRVHDEQELIYTIESGYTRIISPRTQFNPKHRNVTIELNLDFSAFRYGQKLDESCASLIRSGRFPPLDITRRPAPIVLTTTFPQITKVLIITKTPAPLVVTTSFPAHTKLLSKSVSPVVLTFSSPGFVRDLAGVDVAGTIPSMYLPAKQKIWSGGIDLNTDDIRVMLLMTNTTADTELDKEFIANFTTLDEFNGVGYSAGGAALVNEAVNQDTPNARAEFDADDLAFGALSNGTRLIDAGIVYKFVTNNADSIPIFLLQFTNFNPGGSALTLEWNAEGIAWLT